MRTSAAAALVKSGFGLLEFQIFGSIVDIVIFFGGGGTLVKIEECHNEMVNRVATSFYNTYYILLF